MSYDPDQLRRDIETTQGNLSRDVDALTETVRPGNVARRQKDKVTSRASGLKDRIMGKAHDLQPSGSGSGSGSGIGDKASDAASAVQDTAGAAQSKAQEQVHGNPLAAGLVALGVGAIIGSLMPASRKEQQAAVALKERAEPVVEQAKEEVKQAVKETAQDLKPAATSAAGSVASQAMQSAKEVQHEGQASAQDVKDSAQQAKDEVQRSRES